MGRRQGARWLDWRYLIAIVLALTLLGMPLVAIILGMQGG